MLILSVLISNTMKILKISAIIIGLAALYAMATSEAQACTRAVYLGPGDMIVTGRTMDWREEMPTNLWLFPRGIERVSFDKGPHLTWTSKYGSIIAASYDIGTSDGMNEKGLVVNLLYLTESRYTRPGTDNRPVMGMSIWAQYVLDNFATVSEAVAVLGKDSFRIDAPTMPGGQASTMHMSISDSTGNSAIIEYLDGNISIHQGRQYQVLTNSPSYDKQLAVRDYWMQIGGFTMLPGTNRSDDRFVRASFYINAIKQSPDPKIAVASVFSAMRSVSVPFGISSADQPNNSSTRWRSVSNQKDRVYYFETTLAPSILWVDLAQADLKKGAPVRKLTLVNGEEYAGDCTRTFKESKPMTFLFELPAGFSF